ncbi:ubiquinol-cytochrome c reductase iron-sulfur subunit [Sciscionella sediminilitoris]|uniref:cytochrome bc1 complex Rieske iron-sulfur subunit n=1 Tax=Sciscionella sediminilitoris TaxID=1445613 RepID=UPI0004DF054B|nr:ubiquinol-cytochrome c reductase iron-sulfur subunit [Sciscionella sp. SE31]
MSGNEEEPKVPSEEELAEMSRDELVELGAKLDGVELVDYNDPWPVKGTRAEKRSERLVAMWFGIGALAAALFFVVFLWWPWQYAEPGHQFLYSLYTPLVGLTLGIAVLSLGIGALVYTKRFIPHELAVQQRHDGRSGEVDRQTVLAELADAGNRSTIARRSLVKTAGGTAVGILGIGALILPLGGLIKNPWAKSHTDPKDTLRWTGWREDSKAKTVFLRKDNGKPDQIELVRPGDMDAGGMQTVYPLHVPNELKQKVLEAQNDPEKLRAVLMREDTTDHRVREEAEKLWEENKEQLHRVDTPVMLIRLRSSDARKVIKRKGQENFNYGDFYAYTKICSHLGCPTSLYEQQTNRILCPCHQSQFNALEYAKPIFGPAARALAQLPIDVDPETGYLYAKGDFIEPVGPAYWERRP